ncbi:MAG TPA: hypothetical protein VFQ30_20305 [Ktedonobacteraceae bacterium]|nr:hypothetical protein [Ktedonobacteraceae bacterium]
MTVFFTHHRHNGEQVPHGLLRVDPLRQAVPGTLHLPPFVSSQLRLGVQIFGITLSVPVELLIVGTLGVIFVSWAALSFGGKSRDFS